MKLEKESCKVKIATRGSSQSNRTRCRNKGIQIGKKVKQLFVNDAFVCVENSKDSTTANKT